MSGLALQRIAKNVSTKETGLDLGNCGLDEIPAEIGDLVWVEHLKLANDWPGRGPENRFTDLTPLAHLPELQSLHLSHTQVTELAPLAHLTSLQWLNLSFTQVTDLAPLAHLTGLQRLDFTKTQVTDLAPLAQRIKDFLARTD